MVRVDGTYIQEIKDHFSEMAKREIAIASNDPKTEELNDDDIAAIHSKYKYQANQKIFQLMDMKPEKLFKMGLTADSSGWREGYTKPLIKDRKAKSRAKRKMARKTRQQQRK